MSRSGASGSVCSFDLAVTFEVGSVEPDSALSLDALNASLANVLCWTRYCSPPRTSPHDAHGRLGTVEAMDRIWVDNVLPIIRFVAREGVIPKKYDSTL